MTNFGHRAETDQRSEFAALFTKQKRLYAHFNPRGDKILNDDAFMEKFAMLVDVYGGPTSLARKTGWETTGKSVTAGSETIDQVARLVEEIKTTPDSRRLILTAWNADTTFVTLIPSCHAAIHI